MRASLLGGPDTRHRIHTDFIDHPGLLGSRRHIARAFSALQAGLSGLHRSLASGWNSLAIVVLGCLPMTVRETIKTTCPRDCYDACGITVTRKDGIIANVLGDQDHPVSRGALCGKCAIAYNG